MINENLKPVMNTSEANVERLIETYLEPYSNELKLRGKTPVKDVFTLPQYVEGEIFTYYLMAHFDFVICSMSSNRPLLAIEYDGPYHDEEDTERRDELKNYLCNLTGFRLMRISYTNELKDIVKIIDVIKEIAGLSQTNTPNKQTANYISQNPNTYIQPPSYKKPAFRKKAFSGANRKKYDSVTFGDVMRSLLVSVKRTRIFRLYQSYVRLLGIILLIALVYAGINDLKERHIFDRSSSPTTENHSSSQASTKNSATTPSAKNLVLSFVVGKHPGSKGTYIEIRDGSKTIASSIYKEGTKMEFFKNKQVIISKAGSKSKAVQLTHDIINLEVANNYTKVIQGKKSYSGLRKFRYDFKNGKILKRSK
ncbi:hypothetical protein Cpap_0875 [Ruminiclostridium papyrosolvens DSM 2782]|uniref:DUF2726 domain-containing protein n=1 Tax=Ruminiclostridium papyrosolvens DSM 2782 TaxID=588581 RepID=F1TH23_9FIRM|nr:DUF2726 domain-containing protein [Ruminiclostridium papyrosolvens]EGD46263.1 hypothetical protein Cpap_0875 [Ruminiclostridium papyrosolvens DSM 2782]WES33015.1 DUF2726 domain-containing protein [Ruminiclostridium papyrosolvens DSM 2782]